jgi:cytochrome P450
LEFLAELHALPEPIVRIRLGRDEAYVVTAPELLDSLLRGKISQCVEKGAFFDAMRVVLGDGIVVSAEPKHMRHRRLMAPGFHRERIAGYVDIMADSTSNMVDAWHAGQRIELDRELGGLAMRIVAQALFSSDIAEELVSESLRAFPVIVAELPKRTMIRGWPGCRCVTALSTLRCGGCSPSSTASSRSTGPARRITTISSRCSSPLASTTAPGSATRRSGTKS